MELTTHPVEGTDPGLFAEIIRPGGATAGHPLPPVLLLHGFASNSQLNWHTSGWIGALTAAGRTVITVDLPGHGRSAGGAGLENYRPSRIRADLLQILSDAGVLPLNPDDGGTGVDIIGYSLGSRLAWEFGATQLELVRRMVLGGPGSRDPLAEFDLPGARASLAGGPDLTDPSSAELLRMARLVPENNLDALFLMIQAIKEEPFLPAEAVPAMPLLLVAGDRDELAATAPGLVELSGQAELVLLPGRTHANAVTSRVFKQAAIGFLG